MKPLLIALALLAGLAVACSSDSANDSDIAGSAGSMGATGATGSVGAPVPGGEAGEEGAVLADSSIARLVVTSHLSLEVTDMREAYRRAGEAARGLGGFLAEGSIATGADGEPGSRGSLRLRVPYEQHDALLDNLRRIGSRVTREETATTEVTGEYTDLQSRVANLRRSEAQYQAFLERSGSIEEVLDVAARLDQVRGEIEQLIGRINLLADQSDFATVAVTLSLPAVARQAAVDEPASLPSPITVFVNALEASLDVAHAVVNVTAVLLVLAIWCVPVALAYVVLRRPIQRLVQASKARLS